MKDYLAARKSGLLILRYSERMLETENELIGLPDPFYNVVKDNSRQTFIVDKSPFDSKKIYIFLDFGNLFGLIKLLTLGVGMLYLKMSFKMEFNSL